jgi:uncharacterized protein
MIIRFEYTGVIVARPNKKRNVGFNPNVNYFKPRGIPLRDLEEVTLTIDACEAIRLADYLGLSHENAGREMGVSRTTFGRIIQKARKTMADALIHGLAIRIEGSMDRHINKINNMECDICKHQWEQVDIPTASAVCPECQREQSKVKFKHSL